MKKSLLVECVGYSLAVVGLFILSIDIVACVAHAPFRAEPFTEIAAWTLVAFFVGLWLIELED